MITERLSQMKKTLQRNPDDEAAVCDDLLPPAVKTMNPIENDIL